MKKYFSLIPFLFCVLFVDCGGTLPQVVKFNTRPQQPWIGDTVLLEWVVRGADRVTVDGIVVPDSGNKWIVLDSSKDFILVASATRAEFTKKLHIVAERK